MADKKIHNTHLDEVAHQEFVARMNTVRAKHPHAAARGGIIAHNKTYICGVCSAPIVKVDGGWAHT